MWRAMAYLLDLAEFSASAAEGARLVHHVELASLGRGFEQGGEPNVGRHHGVAELDADDHVVPLRVQCTLACQSQ